MARLELSYSDLYSRVSYFLGLTDSGTAPTGQDLIDCKDIVHRGLRQFCYPLDVRNGEAHYWSFLQQFWTLNANTDQWKYALPIDYSDLLSDMVFDTGEWLPPLQKRSAMQIKEMRSIVDSSGWPQYYAIVPSKYDLATGSMYELWLYPKPSQAYSLPTFYMMDPLKPSGTTDLMVGGISATEAILESCLAVAEHQDDEMATTHHQVKSAELIQTLIRFDSGKIDTAKIGNLYNNKLLGMEEERLLIRDINKTRDIYNADR